MPARTERLSGTSSTRRIFSLRSAWMVGSGMRESGHGFGRSRDGPTREQALDSIHIVTPHGLASLFGQLLGFRTELAQILEGSFEGRRAVQFCGHHQTG